MWLIAFWRQLYAFVVVFENFLFSVSSVEINPFSLTLTAASAFGEFVDSFLQNVSNVYHPIITPPMQYTYALLYKQQQETIAFSVSYCLCPWSLAHFLSLNFFVRYVRHLIRFLSLPYLSLFFSILFLLADISLLVVLRRLPSAFPSYLFEMRYDV